MECIVKVFFMKFWEGNFRELLGELELKGSVRIRITNGNKGLGGGNNNL